MVKYDMLFGNRKAMYNVNSLRTHVSDYLIVISGQWLNDVTKLPFSRFGFFTSGYLRATFVTTFWLVL